MMMEETEKPTSSSSEDEEKPSEQPSESSSSRGCGWFGCRNNRSSTSDDAEIDPMKWASEEPEANANFISKLFFWWMQPLFSRASLLHKHEMALQQSDLVPLSHLDYGNVVSSKFEETWASLQTTPLPTDPKKKKQELERRLRKSLLSVIGRRLAIAGIVKFFNTALQFTFPLLLNAILTFIERSQRGDPSIKNKNAGYALAVALLVAMAAKAITENAYFHLVNRCGWQAKASISAAVYKKSLRLSASERGTTTLGELLNLMQVDAEKIELFMPQVNVLWDGAFQIIGYMT